MNRIRNLLEKGVLFHPLLISVKTTLLGDEATVEKLRADAMKLIVEAREQNPDVPSFVFMLVLLGAGGAGKSRVSLGEFPFDDCFLALYILDNDPFGISKVTSQIRCALEETAV